MSLQLRRQEDGFRKYSLISLIWTIYIVIFQIDSDNRFDKDTYIELTKDIDLEPENRKIFDDCIDDYGEYSPDEDEYNDVGLMIEHCLYSAIQLQCEPEKQKDQVGCEQLQKFLSDGADQDVCPTFTS